MPVGAYAKDDRNCCFCDIQCFQTSGTQYGMSAPRNPEREFCCWVRGDLNGNLCSSTDRDLNFTYCGTGSTAISQCATSSTSTTIKYTAKYGANYACTEIRYATNGYPAEKAGTLLATKTARGEQSIALTRAVNTMYYIKFFHYDNDGNLLGSNCTTTVYRCFTYTGADQSFVACKTGCYCAIVYGASGNACRGGCTTGVLYLTAGQTYMVMAGGGYTSQCNPNYGFAGRASSGYTYAGGGMSGIFCGSGAIGASDITRALLIAGGAGGRGRCAVDCGYAYGCGGGACGCGTSCASGGTDVGRGTIGCQNTGGQFCGGATTGSYQGSGGGGRWGGNGSCYCCYGGGGGSGYVNTGLSAIVKSGTTTVGTGAGQNANGYVILYEIN